VSVAPPASAERLSSRPLGSHSGSHEMNRSPLLTLVLLCLVTACSGASIQSPQSAAQETPVPTTAPLPPTPRESPVPSQTPRSTLGPLTPRLVRRCPAGQRVPVEALALDPTFRVLAGAIPEDTQESFFLVSGSDPLPREIPIPATQNGWSLTGADPSPSGEQLITWYSSTRDGPFSLWFTSLDGRQQREIVTLQIGERPQFISDRELVVLGDPEDDMRLRPWEYVPLYTRNTSTGESVSLPPLPDLGVFPFYFTHLGRAYALYSDFEYLPHAYYLYDYTSNTSSPIFQWLDSIEGSYPLIPSPHRRYDGSFIVTVSRSYGFDIAVDLTLQQALNETSYREVMTPVILPGGDSSDIISLVLEDVGKDAFPVLREYTESGTESFYMFNYRTALLVDYCLQPGRVISVSPDGRYLVGSLTHLSDEDYPLPEPYAVVILDLESGHYAAIDGFMSRGWVVDLP